MLIMLIPGELWEEDGGAPPQKEITLLTFPQFYAFFSENVLKTGEILIMLIFWGPFGPGGFSHSPWGINMINIINISPVLSTFEKRN